MKVAISYKNKVAGQLTHLGHLSMINLIFVLHHFLKYLVLDGQSLGKFSVGWFQQISKVFLESSWRQATVSETEPKVQSPDSFLV